jgi:hypothetical protein
LKNKLGIFTENMSKTWYYWEIYVPVPCIVMFRSSTNLIDA